MKKFEQIAKINTLHMWRRDEEDSVFKLSGKVKLEKDECTE